MGIKEYMTRERWFRGAIGFAVLLLVALVLFVFMQRETVPNVAFVSLKGERYNLQDLRGKVVLVNFWATDCPGCVKEMPRLVDTYHRYQSRGVELIAVAMSHDRPDYVANFAEKKGLPFPVALDIQGEISRAFGDVRLTPTLFVIDKQGKIIQRTLGEPDFDRLYTLLDKSLL